MRRSVGVSSPVAAGRPPMRASSARVLSAHSRAPSSSKIASACSSASSPAASSSRAFASHRAPATCGRARTASRRARARPAPSRARRARLRDRRARRQTRPRQRAADASAEARSSCARLPLENARAAPRPLPCDRARSALRSRRAVKRTEPGSRTPPASSRAPSGPSSAVHRLEPLERELRSPSAQAPRIVAIITPRASALRERGLGVSSRPVDDRPARRRTSARRRGRRRAAAPGRPGARGRFPPRRADSASSQLPARNSAQQSWARIHGSALSSARSSACSRSEPEQLARTRELINPGQDDGESEGRADDGLNGARLRSSSSRPRRRAGLHSLPPVTASTRPELAESDDLHASVPRLFGQGDRRASMVHRGGQVASQQAIARWQSPSSARALSTTIVLRVQSEPRGTAGPPADGRPRTPLSSRASRGSRRAGAQGWAVARDSLRSSLARSPSPASQALTAAWTVRRCRLSSISAGVSRRASSASSAADAKAPRPVCPLGRVLELGGDVRIRALGPKRQMARTLLQIGKQLRQAAMERSALGAVGLGVHARGQQRVGEADAVALRARSRAPRAQAQAVAPDLRRRQPPRAPASAAIEPMPPAARCGSPVEAT